jgi:DNA-binding PadR family transcriptional regulator
MRPGTATRFALLGLLLDQPSHGYDLYQRFSDPAGLGQVWHLGMSQMYADLKTLEASGWVSARREQQGARPAKNIFTLTKDGRTAFQEWMAQPSRGLREMRVEFIVRLYFAQRRTPNAVAALIARQEESLREELGRLRQSRPSPHESAVFVQVVHSFRLSQIEAALTWLRSVRKLTVRSKPQCSGSGSTIPKAIIKGENH